jgi:hypothetical protein
MAEWFEQKRYGLGAGRPIAWQGWLVLGVYLAIVIAAAQLADRNPWITGSVVITATALLLVVAARTTRGGWRWRWGGRD